MTAAPILIKVGGNELADPAFVSGLVDVVRDIQHESPVVIVHGGGRSIDALMHKLDITPQYHNGQRITTEETLAITEMVLSGQINKSLTLALLQSGFDALGLSGVDRALLQVEAWGEGMGRVGRIVHVKADILHNLCAQQVIPVISPISIGPQGKYNVNADHAAGAIAGALHAERAIFLTNVPGVLVDDQPLDRLTPEETQTLIEEGDIHGGMIPKVKAALDALQHGARTATITNLAGLQANTGTTFAMIRRESA